MCLRPHSLLSFVALLIFFSQSVSQTLVDLIVHDAHSMMTIERFELRADSGTSTW